MSSWQALEQELELWQQSGRVASLWWRDDDAQSSSDALATLNALSLRFHVPLQLAVIPDGVDASLCKAFDSNSQLYALQHGFSHQNHAPADQRKCELGDHRDLQLIVDQLEQGRELLQQLLKSAFIPALVPPWNRLSDSLPARIGEVGFCGLSTLGPRVQAQAHGLTQVNVHIDIIDWKRRRFAGDEHALAQLVGHLAARRQGRVDAGEATGLMTHHLAHDAGCWDFCERLLAFCEGRPVRWLNAETLFPQAVAG